ncbi:MAG: secondary thiamine-phosphate synthase enzyme YjbQ [Proteobacteria bacterium]|nr:secondary thiamine-phosphate synthase enzyme YjbQ [Pseudomonadota bacterium]MBU1547337.1 secondary thiamine-phosphate synthase enzyme YjbQ [Pseudomonadota bacterium]MBU2620015.1 secondary thiamine-phosphate synthase enzyme YjbQ [Pseudomonadota bacterium]
MPAGTLVVSTSATMQFSDITAQLQKAVTASTIVDGVCHVYNPHTTAGLTINEGADPDVQSDILAALQKIVPHIRYRHAEGNSPAHVMASLTGSSVTVFIENGRLQLGTWQKIFFCEFDGPRSRKVLWRII